MAHCGYGLGSRANSAAHGSPFAVEGKHKGSLGRSFSWWLFGDKGLEQFDGVFAR